MSPGPIRCLTASLVFSSYSLYVKLKGPKNTYNIKLTTSNTGNQFLTLDRYSHRIYVDQYYDPWTVVIVFSYVHSVMCYKDLRATINPYYKPKISEES